jgi:hypothetical protein
MIGMTSVRKGKSLQTLYSRFTSNHKHQCMPAIAHIASVPCCVEIRNEVMPEPVSMDKHSHRIEQYSDYNVSGARLAWSYFDASRPSVSAHKG